MQFEDERFDRLFEEIILNLNFAHDRTQETLDKAYFISTYIQFIHRFICVCLMDNEYLEIKKEYDTYEKIHVHEYKEKIKKEIKLENLRQRLSLSGACSIILL